MTVLAPPRTDRWTPAPRTRVAVVGGGRSPEHDVSLGSARAVADALDTLPGRPYDVVRLTIDRQGCWRDDEHRPLGLAGAVQVLRTCDVAFPLVHGANGEDGSLAALFELAGVRYVGSGLGAGAVGMDKWVTKAVARSVGVRTAPGRLVDRRAAGGIAWDGPVVVKPVAAGSSLGVTLVREPGGLAAALEQAFALGPRVLVEDVVVGREVCVAVLERPDGSRLVPPVEEVLCDGVFDHSTKYGGDARVRIPAALTAAEQEELERAALVVFDALGCRGLARVDFFVTADGPVLNEVNTVPGMTPGSAVPLMFAAGGTAYGDLLDLLVRDALAGAVVPA